MALEVQAEVAEAEVAVEVALVIKTEVAEVIIIISMVKINSMEAKNSKRKEKIRIN